MAADIRSFSIKIFCKLGTIEANIVTMSFATGALWTSAGFSDGAELLSLSAADISSANPKGLIVNVAESSREKRS